MFDSQSGTGRDESLFAEGDSRNSPRWSSRRGRLIATRPTDEPCPGGPDELLGSGGSRAPYPAGRERDVRPPPGHRHPPRGGAPRQRGPPPGARIRGGRADEPPTPPRPHPPAPPPPPNR